MRKYIPTLIEYEDKLFSKQRRSMIFKIMLIILMAFNFIYAQKTHNAVYEIKQTNEVLYLTDRDYKLIEQNYKYYHWAATMCDIPVEVLIAIHYRECELLRGRYSYRRKITVHNLGGPFMLDCGGEGTPDFENNIRYYERKIAKKYDYKGDIRVSHNFEFACLVAANEIKSKARYGFDTKHGIADTFWGYNGRAHKSYLDSAYVSSDPENGNVMSFKFSGRTIVDTRPGCLVIWKELKHSKKLQIIKDQINN